MIGKVVYDPLNKYPGVAENDIHESNGLLINWAIMNMDAGSIKEALEAGYGFPCYDLEGKVEDGVYKSPYAEDEDLNPLVLVEPLWAAGEKLYIYPYGIVGVVKDGKSIWVSRLD